MTFNIAQGAVAPALTLTITDTLPIATGFGVVLRFTDSLGVLLFTDAAPTVDTTNPLAVIVTHTWQAGQTATAGTFGVQAFVGGLAYPETGPLTYTVGMPARAPYCTVAQAKTAGATGTDAEVSAAIVAASARVDRFTADQFTPGTLTVVGTAAPDGTVLLRRRVRSVTSVSVVGGYGGPASALVPSTGYMVLSSATPGQVDALILGGRGVADALVVGAEPWNGGYAGLLGSAWATGQVSITGSFGWDAPPPEVVGATALLAAHLGGAGVTGLDPTMAGGASPDVDEEGNVTRVSVTAPGPELGARRTTGLETADAILAPYVRSQVRLA